MTRMQVLSESPAWLRLMMEAHHRLRSEATLLGGQVNLAAMAATQTTGGNRLWQKVARRLERDCAAGFGET